MKFETLARRIAEKVGCPPLEQALLEGDVSLIPEESHLIWTGKKTQEGLRRRMVRDYNMRPEIVPVYQRPFAQITFNRKGAYVHRLVFDRVFGIPPGGRLENICWNTLCINPYHWVLRDRVLRGQQTQEIPEPPEISDEWSIVEAVEILEWYLETNTTIDREHAYLIDMPEEFLRAGLEELKKGHLLRNR